jgi:flavin reductase (DIM6/NTAB) family NADH-FMN oxidoreductase RutF
MHLDFSALDARDAYKWMIATIVPRPIAWVSTISNETGESNLAPFSFFQGITASPPTLMFVPVTKRDGQPKDTLRNIAANKEFVVNMVSAELAEAMSATSAALPFGESEFERFGVESAPSTRVRPTRVRAARVAFECVLHSIVQIGEGAGGANVVFGRILCAHVEDTVLGADGLPDAAKLDLIGRMGGDDYCTTRDRFSVERA